MDKQIERTHTEQGKCYCICTDEATAPRTRSTEVFY